MNSFKSLYEKEYQSPVFLSEQLKLRFLSEVKRKMDEQGVTKSELARRIHASPAYISKLFRGPTNISAETMAKLTHALDANVHIHLANKDANVRLFDIWQNNSPAPLSHARGWSNAFFEIVKESPMHVENHAASA